MIKMKRFLALALSFCMLIPATGVLADDDVRPERVTKIISYEKNITVGTSFGLKAMVTPQDADDDDLRWSIVGKKGIVRFEDDDDDDDEIELKAIKAGTTKVRCSIKGKSKKYAKTITIKVTQGTYAISRVGQKNVKVEVGDDFELEVKKSRGLRDKQLKWSIKNTKIVDYDEDDDRYGDEIELDAKKIGKTVVTCRNLKTNKTIKFSVQVIADDDGDDDWDDDDRDDD